MLVFGSVHAAAHCIGSLPKLGFETQVRPIVVSAAVFFGRVIISSLDSVIPEQV